MKPMSEAHFAILRRHMVEVIGIQVDLASEELGKAALDERVLAAMCPGRRGYAPMCGILSRRSRKIRTSGGQADAADRSGAAHRGGRL